MEEEPGITLPQVEMIPVPSTTDNAETSGDSSSGGAQSCSRWSTETVNAIAEASKVQAAEVTAGRVLANVFDTWILGNYSNLLFMYSFGRLFLLVSFLYHFYCRYYNCGWWTIFRLG